MANDFNPTTGADSEPEEERKPLVVATGHGGFLAALTVLMLLVFAFIYYQAYKAESLADIDGYNPPAGSVVRNLRSLLAVGLSSGKNIAVSEREINGYLAATLRAKQVGSLADKAKITGVAVRLRDGMFEVILARKLFGRPHTVAMNFTLAQEVEGGKGGWQLQSAGGKIGRLPIPGGFVVLIMDPMAQIAKAYGKELQMLRHASSLRLEDGRILLGAVGSE